jgi:hypothetical protein
MLTGGIQNVMLKPLAFMMLWIRILMQSYPTIRNSAITPEITIFGRFSVMYTLFRQKAEIIKLIWRE